MVIKVREVASVKTITHPFDVYGEHNTPLPPSGRLRRTYTSKKDGTVKAEIAVPETHIGWSQWMVGVGVDCQLPYSHV